MKLSVAPTMKSTDELTVIVDVSQVFQLTGWTIDRLRGAMARGEFPLFFAKNPMRWRKSDLVAWAGGDTRARLAMRRRA